MENLMKSESLQRLIYSAVVYLLHCALLQLSLQRLLEENCPSLRLQIGVFFHDESQDCQVREP